MAGQIAQWFSGLDDGSAFSAAVLAAPFGIDLAKLCFSGFVYHVCEPQKFASVFTISEVLAWQQRRPQRPYRAVEKVFGLASITSWLLCFMWRRPTGLFLAWVSVLLAGFGLACCPIPASREQHNFRGLLPHYIATVVMFFSFVMTLGLAHGTSSSHFSVFLLLILSSGTAGIAGHLRPRLAESLRALTAALEWSSMIFFYCSLMSLSKMPVAA